MKKLIEEIETRANESATREGVHSSPFEEGVAVGLNIALQIVKAHNPWIPISELPPREVIDGDEKSYTIDVITKDNFGEIWKAFYSHGRNVWYESYGENILVNTPTHWTFLPEAQP